jgi:hypothetical protein
MLLQATKLLIKLTKRKLIRKWKNNELQSRFIAWGRCALGYIMMHPPFSQRSLALEQWELSAKEGCQIAR